MHYANLVLNMTSDLKTEILHLVEKIENLIPVLVNLTTKEKKQGYTLGKRADSIHEKCKVLMQNNMDLLAPGFSVNDYVTKANDRQTLIELQGAIDKLQHGIACTLKALDQECARDVLTFYKYTQAASNQNRPGATQIHQEMKELINKRSKAKTVFFDSKKKI